MRVAVYGGAGYSGLELARWLHRHPAAELVGLSSNQNQGAVLRDFLPSDRGLRFSSHEDLAHLDWSLAFLATPAEVSQELAPRLLEGGRSVIDLSGAFRLPQDAYPEWYGFSHGAQTWLERAIYGLPELFDDPLPEGPVLISNPGCYATAAALSLGPLVQADCIADTIFIDGKSGTSGAGKKVTERLLFSEVAESLAPYRVGNHQHTPEIERTLASLGRRPRVLFAPHLIPMKRGLLTTSFAEARGDSDPLAVLEAHYEGSGLVEVCSSPPSTGSVRDTAVARVHALRDARTGGVVAFGALDNLVKGAAGQAIQNLNRIMKLPLCTGLEAGG
ncbi:MAG: N-acetyl-gamma-glutamyl-phosphate reductase [Myxococcota bacterium]